MDLTITEKTDKLLSFIKYNNIKTMAIDGRCASGKTTLSNILSEKVNAEIIRMDDFFLPLNLRTKERLALPGGNVHYERFIKEVIEPLKEGKSFTYHIFNCSIMDYLGEKKIEGKGLVIIEGTYALSPIFNHYYDKGVFFTLDEEEQKGRLLERSPEKYEAFISRWIPMEENYFNSLRIEENADLVL